MKTTPMLLCDAYKLAHREQYPQYTTKVFSTWTPRDSRIPGITEVVFFGLQATIKKYLIEYFDDNFFRVPLKQVIQEYKDYVTLCLGEKDPEVQHIVDLHNLGFLPLKIKALPEGTVSPIRVPQATIENTDPRFFWLTNFLETLLSCELWHQSTCATIAKKYREILESYALLTVGNLDFVQFQGHDFSMRGHTTVDSAIAAGAAHLTSFVGSDTVPAVAYLTKYYNADPAKELVGTSVKATEHSVMCAHGQDEMGCFRKLLTETYPAGIVSVVSDTWDLWEVVAKVLLTLKDEIMGRDGKLVVRPDSGSPADILCGDPNATNPYAKKGLVECLWDIFGGTMTPLGYKLLDSHIGTIYGDSITLDRCQEICARLAKKGFASINVVMGIGSYTYQYLTRDTFGYAMKATYVEINGKGIDIFKDPATDPNKMKKSQKGRVAVVKFKSILDKDANGGTLEVVDQLTDFELNVVIDELVTVFEDGELLVDESLADIRARLRA